MAVRIPSTMMPDGTFTKYEGWKEEDDQAPVLYKPVFGSGGPIGT
jgi:hypothetical protein